MIRKGRRGRSSKRSVSVGRQPAAVEEVVVPASEAEVAEAAIAAPPSAEPLVAEPLVAEPPAPEPAVVPEPPVPASLVAEPPMILQPETPVAFDRPGDEASFPPVDLDNHFFEGPASSRAAEPILETEERDPRMALKLTPEAARRRADLAKYVKLAVAGASVLCLAALVKVAVARGQMDEGARRPMMAAAAQAPKAALSPADPLAERKAVADPPAPPPTEIEAVADPPAPPPADTQAVADPPAPPPAELAAAAPAPTESANVVTPPGDTPELDPKAAAKEKNTSRAALERGKVADAIESGERSVALDPTDGEAWLILGASYQQKGDMKNARRSYKACLDQGKRGPKYECAAMPH